MIRKPENLLIIYGEVSSAERSPSEYLASYLAVSGVYFRGKMGIFYLSYAVWYK